MNSRVKLTLSGYQSKLNAKYGKGVIEAKAYVNLNTEVKHYLPKANTYVSKTPRNVIYDRSSDNWEYLLDRDTGFTSKTISRHNTELRIKWPGVKCVKYVPGDAATSVYVYKGVEFEARSRRVLNESDFNPDKAIRLSRLAFNDKEAEKHVKECSNGLVRLLEEYTGSRDPHKLQCTQCDKRFKGLVRPSKQSYACPKCSASSRYSQSAIKWLSSMSYHLGIFIKHEENFGEHTLILKDGKQIRVDGFSRKYKLVFEFYGDAFHGHKSLGTLTKPHPFNDKTAHKLRKNTLAREQEIKKLGYKVVRLWEHDYRNRYESWLSRNLPKIKEYLNEISRSS
jgi:hypothetical protein